MAAADGTRTTPPPHLQPLVPASPTSAKRKRPDAEADAASQAIASASPSAAHADSTAARPLHAVLRDIVAVLMSYDPQPSLLHRPVASITTRAASGESESKRAKLAVPTTVASLVRDSAYASLEAFEKDVETATSDALDALEPGEPSDVQPSAEHAKLQAHVLAFRNMARILIAREDARRSSRAANPESSNRHADGGDPKGDSTPVQIKEEDAPESRAVLTLYGSAQGPKQLFSSLQQPVTVAPQKPTTSTGLDTSVKVTLPLDESSLPNIISTTQVFPLPEESEQKKSTTFGELFPPPAHLPQLSPPKLVKPQTGRGNTITFAPLDSQPNPYRKSSHIYATQPLATGHWLGYGGVDMPKDPTSPTAKQKSRQRALSTGEAQQPPSEAALAAVQQAKEDALFRSAYSSFAPSRDDSVAIVPAETKNMVWWQKVGKKRFQETFPIDPELLKLDQPAEAEPNETLDEDEGFKWAVDNFVPIEDDPFQSSEKSDLEKSTDELLQEISELVEVLASHQRIRNSTLARNPRTPVIQNSTLATLAGSPTSPSSEEIDVYQMLKSQLTLMIAQLPPYAVAKLNGDQLDELNISRTIIIETDDHKGVLEEDQFSRRSAVPMAPAPPSLTRMGSTGTPSHPHLPPSNSQYPQYPRATPSAHPISVRAPPPVQNFHPQQQQAVHRSPSVHYQRSSSGPTQSYQTPAANYNNSTPRHNYPASQYGPGQQTPRATFAQTPGQSAQPQQYYNPRPAAPPSNYGSVANPQYYQSTPQAQQPQRFPPQQQTQNGFHQQRPQNAPTYNYSAAATPQARTGSPLKATPVVAQSGQQPSRYPYAATPGVSVPMRNSFYPQGVPATPQYAPTQPQTPSTAAPGGYSAVVPNHQQMLLERQQAQMAVQSQARLAAQNNLHRHGSGTPQPSNPQYNGQAQPPPPPPPPNGAPMIV